MKRRSQPKSKSIPARSYGDKVAEGNMMYGRNSHRYGNFTLSTGQVIQVHAPRG